MPQKPTNPIRLAAEGISIILICSVAGLYLGVVYADWYQTKTGFDGGNAPVFTLFIGGFVGMILASLYGYYQNRDNQ